MAKPDVLGDGPRTVAAMSGLCFLAAALGLGFGLGGSRLAIFLSSGILVLVTIAAGIVLVRTAGRERGLGYRRWFGLLLLTYGLGAIPDAAGGLLPAWVGLWVALVTLVLIGWTFTRGVLAIPAANAPYKNARSILEALLIGLAGGAFAFRVWFESAVPHWPVALGLEFVLVGLVTLAALAVITMSLDTGSGFSMAVIGAIVIAAGEALFIGSFFLPDLMKWPGRTVAAVGWGCAIIGLFRMPGRLAPQLTTTSPSVENRNVVIVGSLIALTAGAFLSTLAFVGALPTVGWTFTVVFIIVLWIREIVRARQSRDLLQLLNDQARLDPLTGVGNRRDLEHTIDRLTVKTQERASFLTIDLDGFKDVNDQLGHGTGDELLQAVAQTLREIAGGSRAHVFRVGGDEFAAISTDPPAEVEAMALRMVDAVSERGRSVAGVGRVALGVSVGVRHLDVPFGFGSQQAQTALGESGHAMRAAKQSGRGRVVVFDRGLAERHRRRRLVEARLSDPATPAPQVHYQPVVDLSDGRMIGVEALARWTDPVLGTVEPAEFVDIAEDRGLIHALGDHILNVALDNAQENGLVAAGLTTSVNVSTIQLRVPGFTRLVADALNRSKVPPELLVIEVTETIFVRHDDPALKAIDDLARLGIGFSLDDFGAGYSSLSHLARLPVRTLKIDRSLTERMGDSKTRAIVRSVVEMAAGLDLMVVLEGVETAEQVARAKALGVSHAQGWYFRAALTSEALREVMANGQRLGPATRHGYEDATS